MGFKENQNDTMAAFERKWNEYDLFFYIHLLIMVENIYTLTYKILVYSLSYIYVQAYKDDKEEFSIHPIRT